MGVNIKEMPEKTPVSFVIVIIDNRHLTEHGVRYFCCCSLISCAELSQLGTLKLIECTVLEDSYFRLRYRVIG